MTNYNLELLFDPELPDSMNSFINYLQNIKNSSDSLYVVKETDGASYRDLNLDEIKKLLVKNNVSFPNNGFGYAKLN